jgi:N-acetylglucosamine kinase-like BadF-type ATPase
VLGQELRSRKAAIMPDSATLLLVNDGYVGIKSGTDGDWGVCIISGTGSNCFGLNEDGETASAGDWGYILGDLGSAFAVGQKMLRMVMQEYDGRKRRSVISEYVLRHLQMKTALELIPWAYGAQPPVEAIASLAILLQEEEINKLREIQDLLKDITSELFSALLAVTTRLGIEREAAFPIVLTGGQFAQKELADGQLRTLVEAHFPNASLFKAYRSGGEGAAQAAKRLLDPSFILPKGGVLV